jgi:hypothetical protein
VVACCPASDAGTCGSPKPEALERARRARRYVCTATARAGAAGALASGRKHRWAESDDPFAKGLVRGDSASTRSCLPSQADQQAAELGEFGPPSFREKRAHRLTARRRWPRRSVSVPTAVRGGSVRATVDGSGCSSVHVELNGVRIAPPSANFQRTGLMRRRRHIRSCSPP